MEDQGGPRRTKLCTNHNLTFPISRVLLGWGCVRVCVWSGVQGRGEGEKVEKLITKLSLGSKGWGWGKVF